MRGIPIALVLIAAITTGSVVACFQTPEGRATAACSATCSCQAPPVRSAQDQCLTQCVGQLAPIIDQVGDDCIECVVSHANKCTSLEADCNAVCDTGQVDPPPPPPDIVDASPGPIPDAP